MEISDIELFFEKSPNPMLIHDPQSFEIIEVNQAAISQYGYSREEFTSLRIYDLHPPDERPDMKKAVRQTREIFHNAGLWKHRTKEGTTLYMRIVSHPIEIAGRLHKLVVLQDASKEVIFKQHYHKEKELLDTVVSRLPGTFFVINKDLRLLRWNKNTETITGYSHQKIAEMNVAHFFDEHEWDRVSDSIAEVFETGHATLEAPLLTKEGKSIPFLFHAKRIRYEGEECIAGIGIDLSSSKRLMDQRETLFSEIQHRVKNNLALINALIQLEEFEVDHRPTIELLHKIQNRIQIIAHIYELLYQDKDYKNILLDKFFTKVMPRFREYYDYETDSLTLESRISGLTLNINQAIPFALLLNELIAVVSNPSNGRERANKLLIKLKEPSEGHISLLLETEQQPPDLDGHPSLDTMLIDTLTRQLDARLAFGQEIRISFEKKNIRGSSAHHYL